MRVDFTLGGMALLDPSVASYWIAQEEDLNALAPWAVETASFLSELDHSKGDLIAHHAEALLSALRTGDKNQALLVQRRLARSVGRLDGEKWRDLVEKAGWGISRFIDDDIARELVQKRITPSGSIGDMERVHLLMGEDLPATAERLFESINRTLAFFSPRQAVIVRLHFGLPLTSRGIAGKEFTFKEIGKLFDLTNERIRQIEARTLRRLRHPRFAKWLGVFYREREAGESSFLSRLPLTPEQKEAIHLAKKFVAQNPKDDKRPILANYLLSIGLSPDELKIVFDQYHQAPPTTLQAFVRRGLHPDSLNLSAWSAGRFLLGTAPARYIEEANLPSSLKTVFLEALQRHPDGTEAVGRFLADIPEQEWDLFLGHYLANGIELDPDLYHFLRNQFGSDGKLPLFFEACQKRAEEIRQANQIRLHLRNLFERKSARAKLGRLLGPSSPVLLEAFDALMEAMVKKGIVTYLFDWKVLAGYLKEVKSKIVADIGLWGVWVHQIPPFKNPPIEKIFGLFQRYPLLPPFLVKAFLNSSAGLEVVDLWVKGDFDFPEALEYLLAAQNPLEEAEKLVGQITRYQADAKLTKGYNTLSELEKLAMYAIVVKKGKDERGSSYEKYPRFSYHRFLKKLKAVSGLVASEELPTLPFTAIPFRDHFKLHFLLQLHGWAQKQDWMKHYLLRAYRAVLGASENSLWTFRGDLQLLGWRFEKSEFLTVLARLEGKTKHPSLGHL